MATGQVQAFVDRRWPALLQHVEAWRLNAIDRERVVAFVLGIKREWESIALEEKQIPYLPLERTFWAALDALHLCAIAPDGITSPSGKIPENLEADFAEHLETTYSYLRDQKPLPESINAGRRHLP